MPSGRSTAALVQKGNEPKRPSLENSDGFVLLRSCCTRAHSDRTKWISATAASLRFCFVAMDRYLHGKPIWCEREFSVVGSVATPYAPLSLGRVEQPATISIRERLIGNNFGPLHAARLDGQGKFVGNSFPTRADWQPVAVAGRPKSSGTKN